MFKQRWFLWVGGYAFLSLGFISASTFGERVLYAIVLSALLYAFSVLLRRAQLARGWGVLLSWLVQIAFVSTVALYSTWPLWISMLGWAAILSAGAWITAQSERNLPVSTPRYASEAFVPSAILLTWVLSEIAHAGIPALLAVHLAIFSFVILRNSRIVVVTMADPISGDKGETMRTPDVGGLRGYIKAALLPSGLVGLAFIAFDVIMMVPMQQCLSI